MKFYFITMIFIAIAVIDCKSQQLKDKTVFTYSYIRVKEVYDDTGGKSVHIQSKRKVKFEIDTIIRFNSQKRKLVVFNTCFNDVVFSKNFPILKDSASSYNSRNEIEGILLKDDTKNLSLGQISLIYQVENITYLLTMPKTFLKKELKDKMFINNLDYKLSILISKNNSFGIYDTKDSFIFLDGYSMPIRKIVIASNTKESSLKTSEKNDYLNYFYRYQGRKNLNNNLIPKTDLYEISNSFYVEAKFYLVPKFYTMVRSKHSFYDKENDCLYTCKLELTDISK